MKLVADMEVVNRLLPSVNLKSKRKPARSQISVGRKSANDEIVVMLCTQQDRSGERYKLLNNLDQIFCKFVEEGKCTIRFSEPPHDICISKADIVQLKAFLAVLRLGAAGRSIEGVTLSSLAPVSSKQVVGLKTKLVITTRREYPLTSSFPHALESLRISGCSLRSIELRVMRLRHLSVLDVSNNNISALPDDWGSVSPLSSLHLAHNHLSSLPPSLCAGRLRSSLRHLDLSDNRFAQLPPYLADLQALHTLKLDRNALLCLPSTFGRLASLRVMSATANQLQTLPGTFVALRLESLNLSENALMEDGPSSARDRLHAPRLLECAARAVYKHGVAYSAADVGHLVQYLDRSKSCLCGGVSFESHVHYLMRFDLRRTCITFTALDARGRTHAPVEGFLCSRACYNAYLANPTATFWNSQMTALRTNSSGIVS